MTKTLNLKIYLRNDIEFLDDEKISIPVTTIFFDKKDDIGRSTLYSFDGPFQLLHADVLNLEFFGKTYHGP